MPLGSNIACPLWNDTIIEPNQRTRFMCHAHDQSTPRRVASSRCAFARAAPAKRLRAGTLFLIGDSMDHQLGKATACRLWSLHTARDITIERAVPWMKTLDRSRPHASRGAPWCIRIPTSVLLAPTLSRVCVLSAHPTSLATAEALALAGVPKPDDVIVLSTRMGEKESETLELAHALVDKLETTRVDESGHGAVEGYSPLARIRAAGVRLFWRERSPQAFSDSPTGSYSAHTYGRPGQSCAPQKLSTRGPNHTNALQAVRAAGIPTLLVWDLSASQWDLHLARRTPYVRSRLDCTHWCEGPSSVLEAWVDVVFAAIRGESC